ncbi:hypothetical protein K435DRAFT_711352 [Dendrothele bispora CBS 962.96]|uniref:DUF3074 domain-containing protein n=1 Tax=Dendrothele bispora (strain CBS 962.96) TaxID=1314807 RepID=A0A4S8MTJ1_DENBC|nr:hypothetical protein K435DRAFT_711352 [Dendrothele bispora CBS 962.96]
MDKEGFKLTTLSPLKPSDIPPEEAIIASGKKILDASESWRQGKTYHGIVKTFSRPKGPGDGGGWHCRVSEHKPSEASFDQMWGKLGKDNALSEVQFIPDLKIATKIKDISSTASIWSLTFKLSFPFSPRVYTVLQVVHYKDELPRSGIVVSVPIDLSSPSDIELAQLEGQGVQGRYVVVERIMEMENGNTEWRMATTGTAGGNIPQIFVEQTMASQVSEDVPNFMRWLHGLSK